MTQNKENYKSIEIKRETFNKICEMQKELEKILHHKVSYDKLIDVILSPKLVDWSEVFSK